MVNGAADIYIYIYTLDLLAYLLRFGGIRVDLLGSNTTEPEDIGQEPKRDPTWSVGVFFGLFSGPNQETSVGATVGDRRGSDGATGDDHPHGASDRRC